jgi:hypothetical protein
MKSQKPAQGVLQVNDWGNSKMYKVVCECGNEDCTHTVDIEADVDVTVTIYTRTRTNFWSKKRWHHIWQLLTKGHTDFETSIVLDKQTALNYADTLKSAVKDVEKFKKDQHGNS